MTCNWFLEPDKSLGLGPWRAGHIQSKVATMNNVFVGRIRRCICSKGLCSARCIRNWLLTLVDSFGEFYDSGLTCTRILIVTTDIVILKDTRRDYATNTFRCLFLVLLYSINMPRSEANVEILPFVTEMSVKLCLFL